jgi:cell wall-associated NlpC family hydrolase
MITPAVGHADPTPADVDRQLASAWQELEIVIERFNAAREEVRAINARRVAIESQLGPLRQAVDAAQRRVGELSSALYRGGQVSGVSALLGAPEPETLMDQLTVLDHLARRRHREFAALAASRTELERQQRDLTALSTQQRAQQADLAARRTAIEAQIQRLGGRAGRGSARAPKGALNDGYLPAFTSDAAGTAVRFAYSQLGKVYRFAAEGPDAYDCSGLVMASWRAAGVALPHNAARQYKMVRPITRAELKPGDLVFYYRDIHHVALYIGDNRVIEAPRPGERISMRPIDFAPIVGYGRPPGQ